MSCFVLSCDCSDGLEAQSHGKESGIDSIPSTVTQIHYTIFINARKVQIIPQSAPDLYSFMYVDYGNRLQSKPFRSKI